MRPVPSALLLVILVAAAPAAAAVGEGENVTFLSHLGLGPYHALAAAGDTVYAGCGSVLHVVAYDDPGLPLIVGALELDGHIQDLVLRDGLAYAGLRGGGLAVLDVTDPAAPTVAGHVLPTDNFICLEAAGSRLYAGCNNYLRIFDLSDPVAPAELGSLWHAQPLGGLAVDGETVYAACGWDGCAIVDATDPAGPTTLGTWDDGYYAGDAVVDPGHGHVYVCTWGDGLFVVDVGDPAAPAPAAGWDPGGNVRRAVLDGTLLYLACEGPGLGILNVGTPTAPVEVGMLADAGGAEGVALGTHAYVADHERGLLAVDVSVPASPSLAGDMPAPGQARGLAVGGGRAYVAGYRGGWHIIDVGDPAAPTLPYLLNGSMRAAERMLLRGDVLYVVDGYDNLFVYDVSSPGMPPLVGSFNSAGYSRGLDVSGDIVYLSAGSSGVVIADMSDPGDIQHILTLSLADFTWDVKLEGDHLYAADGNGGLRVLDVSDPALAHEVGFHDTDIRATALLVEDGLAYVADTDVGLQIFDVGTPASPALIGTASASYPYGLAKLDRYLYMADGFAGLKIFDVDDPTAPVRVGSFDTGTTCIGVAAEGRRIYLTSSVTGLWILENDLLVPTFLSAFAAARDGAAAVLEWTVAAAPAPAFHVWRQEPDAGRIRLTGAPLAGGPGFRFRDPAAPPGEAEYWLQVPDDAAGGGTWLGPAHLAAADPPRAAVRLGPAWPNPANPAVSVTYALAAPGRAVVRVHDLRGRLVATLVDGPVPAGEHTVRWDGRDAAGRAVASGTYLVRLETAAGTDARKLLLAR